MNRLVEIMDTVGLLDNPLRVVSGEVPGVNLDVSTVQEKKKNIDSLVRAAIPYDEDKYASNVKYERSVV